MDGYRHIAWKVLKWSEVNSLNRVWLFVTLWTAAYQAPQAMKFFGQEYWSGLPFPSPGDLPDPGIEPRYPALQADTLLSETPGKPMRSARSTFIEMTRHHVSPIILWNTTNNLARSANLSLMYSLDPAANLKEHAKLHQKCATSKNTDNRKNATSQIAWVSNR